jgi:hypothetical protein
VSDEAEAARWAQTVRQQWPGAATEALLGMSRPGMRRMVDTDGSTKAEIYLDDLQAHPPLDAAEALRSPGDVGPAMCLSTVIPSGTRSLITRHTEPPFVHLVGPLAEAAADLVDQGAEGVWGLRWRMGQLVSVVWVTEARWRKNPELANGVAAGLGLPRAWDRCCAVLEQAGHLGYPDAIELHADGRVDITLGAIRAP